MMDFFSANFLVRFQQTGSAHDSFHQQQAAVFSENIWINPLAHYLLTANKQLDTVQE